MGTHNCSYKEECKNEVGFFRCLCKEGFELRPDGSCHGRSDEAVSMSNTFFHMHIRLDIDECVGATIHINCSESNNEICINTEGSFVCTCSEGYSRRDSTDKACQGIFLSCNY